jgi:hypothetical protein
MESWQALSKASSASSDISIKAGTGREGSRCWQAVGPLHIGPGLRAWESVPEREEARARHALGPSRLVIMKMDKATFSRWPSSLGAHMEMEKNWDGAVQV